MTTPDMVPAMKRAAGIVTDEGGMTSHAAIVSRELGCPAVVGATDATEVLEDDQIVTLDGDRGVVTEGRVEQDAERDPIEEARPKTPVKPMTATEVKVNVSIPEAAERAAATGADGVGLLRMEHMMILSTNQTPERYIENHGEKAYIQELIDGIQRVAEEFYPRPVRVRTLDAPTDEFRQLEGGNDEPHEHNPMLGYRGIRRSLDRPDVFRHELEAFAELFEMGYDNVEIMFPLVNDADDVRQARELMVDTGIDVDKRTWGVMIETPAAALSIEELAAEGIDFASFGTNDLTQYTLAVDRNNGNVADRFDELHPSVLKLIETTIESCREHDIDTSICGQAGSKTDMVTFLVDTGISSISANIDAVRDVQHEVKREEQRLILDSVRDQGTHFFALSPKERAALFRDDERAQLSRTTRVRLQRAPLGKTWEKHSSFGPLRAHGFAVRAFPRRYAPRVPQSSARAHFIRAVNRGARVLRTAHTANAGSRSRRSPTDV